MITLREVRKSFGDLAILRGVNLQVSPGSVTVVCGPSGTGKTTLLRCVMGLEEIQGGQVVVDGIHVNGDKESLRRLRGRVGMVYQQFSLYPHMTVLQNVGLAPIHVKGLRRAEAEELARELLEEVGIGDKVMAYPNQLSGGQQQRAAIARALAMEPKVLLLDEPTSALDPQNKREVLETIGALAVGGRTMLIATHEMAFAWQVADTLALLEDGRILESAAPEQFLFDPQHERTRHFLAPFMELILDIKEAPAKSRPLRPSD